MEQDWPEGSGEEEDAEEKRIRAFGDDAEPDDYETLTGDAQGIMEELGEGADEDAEEASYQGGDEIGGAEICCDVCLEEFELAEGQEIGATSWWCHKCIAEHTRDREKQRMKIYVMTHPAMPGLVKIGRTQREIPIRVKELSRATGVPGRYTCVGWLETEANTEGKDLERALHCAFAPYRYPNSREFFQIDEEQVVGLLRVWPGEYKDGEEGEGDQSGELSGGRKANMRFIDLGIKKGDEIEFTPHGKKGKPADMGSSELEGVRVHDEMKNRVTVGTVDYEPADGEVMTTWGEEEMSLREATLMLLGYEKGKTLQPSRHWSYKGRVIRDLHAELYGEGSGENS